MAVKADSALAAIIFNVAELLINQESMLAGASHAESPCRYWQQGRKEVHSEMNRSFSQAHLTP